MWIKVTTTDNQNHLINVNEIMDLTYTKDTNLTIITYARSAYPSSYVRGNIIPEITKHLSANDVVATIQVKDGK